MPYRYCAFVLSASLLAPFVYSSVANASSEENNHRLLNYGMGGGVAVTLCDLVENKQISNTVANLFVSNFAISYSQEIDGDRFKSIKIQSMKDGFNAGAGQIPGCTLKY